MKDNLCEIILLLDRSGSMQAVRADMEGAIDAFVKDQREAPGEALMTLVQFNDRAVETVHEAMPIAQVPHVSIVPMGNTPLLDAVGKTIESVGARLRATPEESRPGKVLFLIVTDGQENASRKFSKDKIKSMIEEQTSQWKWQFSFFGANVDAFAEAAAMGIPAVASANYLSTPSGIRGASARMAHASRSYRSGAGFQIPPAPKP